MGNAIKKKRSGTWTISPHELFEYVSEYIGGMFCEETVVNVHDPVTLELELTFLLDKVAKKDRPKYLDDTWCYDLGEDDEIREVFKDRAKEGYNLRYIGLESDPDYTNVLVRLLGYKIVTTAPTIVEV